MQQPGVYHDRRLHTLRPVLHCRCVRHVAHKYAPVAAVSAQRLHRTLHRSPGQSLEVHISMDSSAYTPARQLRELMRRTVRQHAEASVFDHQDWLAYVVSGPTCRLCVMFVLLNELRAARPRQKYWSLCVIVLCRGNSAIEMVVADPRCVHQPDVRNVVCRCDMPDIPQWLANMRPRLQ